METTKSICHEKNEGAVARWFKKFCSGCKKVDDQARSGRLKIVDSEAVLQALEVNLVSSMQRVSGKLGISQYCIVCHIHDFGKSIQSCWIVPNITKILPKYCKTFDSPE